MAGEFQAGSIFISLKAQIENLQKGVAQAKSTLDVFGKGVQGAAAGVEQGGRRITASFDAIDRANLQMTARLARLSNRLLSLQFLFQSLSSGSGSGLGRFKEGMDAVSAGLTTFAGVVTLFPNKIGVVLGAGAGLAATFQRIAQSAEEAKQRILELDQAVRARLTQSLLGRARADLDVELSQRPGVTRLQQEIQRQIPQLEALRLELERLRQEQVELQKRAEGVQVGERMRAVTLMIQDREEKVIGLVDAFNALNEQLKREEALEDFRENLKTLGEQARATEAFLREGLIDPVEELGEQVRIQEQALRKFLALPEEVQARIGPRTIEGVRERLGTLRARQAERDEQEAFEDFLRHLEEERQKQFEDRVSEVDRQAKNLSAAIGQAVTEGILQGQKAMEILANVGRNLFENFLRDVVNNFQTWMQDAFKAITGVAGTEFATLITGIAGIAGLALSRRHGSLSQSFGRIESQVTSSAQVRGIVAGPSSVAIATVSENLERALEPTRQILGNMLQVLIQIRDKGGGRGAGGQPFAGTVPAL